MSFLDLIKKKNARLEAVPDKFLTTVEKVQKRLFTELMALVNDLTVKNGFIELSTANLATVDKIIADLRIAIHDSDYFKAVREFGKEFDVQGDINEKYFKESFQDFTSSAVGDAVVENAKKTAVDALLGAPLDTNFLKPAQDLLTDLVTSGAGWKDSVQAIRDFAEGNEDVDGKLLQYSKQIAHDSFAYSDRSYTNAASDEIDAEWYYYSGGELPTTRCFCEERNGQYFHYKEIEAWGRGEDLGDCRSGDLWAGADRNTNEQTIFILLGGHNCMHSLMPVSIFDVPKDVIERNISKGNYEPTQFESDELGL